MNKLIPLTLMSMTMLAGCVIDNTDKFLNVADKAFTEGKQVEIIRHKHHDSQIKSFKLRGKILALYKNDKFLLLQVGKKKDLVDLTRIDQLKVY